MNKEVIKLVKTSISLESYSESEGFLGWFEASNRECEERLFDRAEGVFLEWVLSVGLEWHLVTSVTNRQPEGIRGDPLSKCIFHCLDDKGWLQPDVYMTSLKTDENFSYEEADKVLNENFKVIDCPRKYINDISQFCRLFFKYYLCGHAFFVWPAIKLVAYPHDDIGFGVISNSEEGDELAKKLFDSVRIEEEFEVFQGESKREPGN